jgi:hypothetical protein
MLSKRIFLANVGANAAHIGKGLQSPRFSDGTFEFVTIPEEQPLFELKGQAADKYLVHYGELKCFNKPDKRLAQYLGKRTLDWPTHYDPEFEHFTYGDECEQTPRSSALKQIRPGDLLFFLARLADYDEKAGHFTGEAGFYLVGFLEIERIVVGVRSEPAAEELARIGHNAHVRRAQARPDLFYDGFYVFEGSARSQRFKVAPAFGRTEAEQFLRDKNGQEWNWTEGRSPLQIIGSYTRACRCVLDPARSAEEATRTQAFLDWLALKL